ncbi:hypothetical protein IFM89_036985 [Coptis chinensis]|uniref:Uncharacterized protein n=1 Tax=Coptis chinensis TaxID=261450 RepID=A0A835H885_9MAGN|nr:hypothetical protein IFM89_036985 [Coptis chinensis]
MQQPIERQGYHNGNVPPPNQTWNHQSAPMHPSQNHNFSGRDAPLPTPNSNNQRDNVQPPPQDREFQPVVALFLILLLYAELVCQYTWLYFSSFFSIPG